MAIAVSELSMKKGLYSSIILALAIFVVGVYFHLVSEKKEYKVGKQEKRERAREREIVLQKNKVSRLKSEQKILPPFQGEVKITKSAISPSWMKNRLTTAKAIRRERDNFEELEKISDSVRTWRISKKYRGIHKNNFVQGTPFISKMGRYYVVESHEGGDAHIVYDKKMSNMGVVSGSLIVKIRPHNDDVVESLLEGWERDENLEVGLTFLHIGVVELKTLARDNIVRMAKRLKKQEGVEQVKIEVIKNDILSW